MKQFYKSKLARYKNIDKRNIAFDKLSDVDKKKEIAWDSLNLLINQELTPSVGSYWGMGLRVLRDAASDGKELQQLLLSGLNSGCKVCARGAVMVSLIRLGNRLDPTTSYLKSGHEDIVRGFSMNEMRLMEAEYEGSHYRLPYFTNTREKLANILCNVIKNGTFDRYDYTDYVKELEVFG